MSCANMPPAYRQIFGPPALPTRSMKLTAYSEAYGDTQSILRLLLEEHAGCKREIEAAARHALRDALIQHYPQDKSSRRTDEPEEDGCHG